MSERIFNMHDFALMMTACQSFLLALLLLLKKHKRPSHSILAAFLALQAIMAVYLMLIYGGTTSTWFIKHFAPNEIKIMGIPLLMQGLLLYWYTKAVLYNSLALKRSELIVALVCVLPMVVMAGYNWYVPRPRQEIIRYDFLVLEIAQACSIFYCFMCLQQIKKYKQLIKNVFSDIERIDFHWLKVLTISFLVLWLWWMLVNLMAALNQPAISNFMGQLHNYLIFILINVLVFTSLSYSAVLENIDLDYTKNNKKTKVNKDLVSQVEEQMKQERYYLISDITLDSLALKLGMQARTLSTVINRHYRQNFYEFINHYRVEEAKSLLADPQNSDKSIQEIFESAGFNSKSTFNALFKKIAGRTPTEYRKKHSKSVTAIT